jgi:predicted DNA-binding WGR domain protein
MSLGVVEKNGKFVVTQNGQPINLPKSDGQSIVTEFTSKADAEKYMSILSTLQKQKKYKTK